MKLNNKRAIITGASCGFGFEVAKYFVSEGAKVMLCARDISSLTEAKRKLDNFCQGQAEVYIAKADVSSANEVKEFVKAAIDNLGTIDILVSNAGIYGPKGPIEEIEWDEWSYAIDINLKGTVLMCRAVVPYMKKQKSGKIVLLSGGGATKPMPNLSAYAASKAAVVRFGETLAGELNTCNIDVNSIAPGALNTRLLDEVLNAGPDKVGQKFYEGALKQKENGGASLELGAKLCVYLASNKSDGITGKLISAVWDPWETLEDHIKDLKKSDIYTLRRIIPSERNMDWGER